MGVSSTPEERERMNRIKEIEDRQTQIEESIENSRRCVFGIVSAGVVYGCAACVAHPLAAFYASGQLAVWVLYNDRRSSMISDTYENLNFLKRQREWFDLEKKKQELKEED